MAVSAESLFRAHFLPLYPEDAKRDLAAARANDANPAKNPSIAAHVVDAARIFEGMASVTLDAPSLALDFTDASVHRLSAALTPAVRDRLAKTGEGADNVLFNLVVHAAAYVGECIVRHHGGVWSMRRPLWESVVRLESAAGIADLAIFHWLLKSLADEPTATLADRYRAHVEVPAIRPDDLPVIAPPDRNLPKIAKPRYDVLYKYLRAHLPEMKDLGEDFPSPERFEELGLKSLSLFLVGGGRMLVIAGPSASGLHAFWLRHDGFVKSAYWPCDAFPDPILRVKEDKIEIVLARDTVTSAFELLWWGP